MSRWRVVEVGSGQWPADAVGRYASRSLRQWRAHDGRSHTDTPCDQRWAVVGPELPAHMADIPRMVGMHLGRSTTAQGQAEACLRRLEQEWTEPSDAHRWAAAVRIGSREDMERVALEMARESGRSLVEEMNALWCTGLCAVHERHPDGRYILRSL